MYQLLRTTAGDGGFRDLVVLLDKDLAIRDGNDHAFFAQYNGIDTIKHVVVAYHGARPIGCGAIKHYEEGVMEVKRMYVLPEWRGRGVATAVLRELEQWAAALGYERCILETGQQQPEAIALYRKNDYAVIPNYGQYAGVLSSVCFEKRVVVL